MTDEPSQLSLLTANGDPRAWPCPTCRGTGRRTGEPGQAPERCRVCQGTGRVTYDPLDQSIPY